MMMQLVSQILVSLLICSTYVSFATAGHASLRRHAKERSFKIVGSSFMKDGQPFRYVSGTVHYWRVPHERWESTFIKMRSAGLNAVDTYLIWNLHEQEPGQYTFEGNLNFVKFIQLAQKHNLLVILRPGPFIAAETDFGGLPYWFPRENATTLVRSNNEAFLNFVRRWYKQSLPLAVPLLYKNGGPIITVQVENEYGAFGCDVNYMIAIMNILKSFFGDDVVYFTNNYPEDNYPNCGASPGALTTGDFGSPTISGKNVSYYLNNLRARYNVTGPLVDTEFYDGWLDTWGNPYPVVPTQEVIDSMTIFLNTPDTSFNIYVFHGGSNWGFEAVYGVTTTYDFNAALTEAGDPTDKYYAIRALLAQYVPLPPGPPPTPSPKMAYGKVQMFFAGTVYDNLKRLSPDGPVTAQYPLPFEFLKQGHGFVLYRTEITHNFQDPSKLQVDGLNDRATVLLDKTPVGILDRRTAVTDINLIVDPPQTLDLLVLNEGRGGFSPHPDMKGILQNVTLNGDILTNWKMYGLKLPHYPMRDSKPLGFQHRPLRRSGQTSSPAFYSGTFFIPAPVHDTFLNLEGWRTGYAFLNGKNLGRYWPVRGPQLTLYIPSVFLRENEQNTLELFELEKSPCQQQAWCSVEFIDYPILNATVPTFGGKKDTRIPQLTRMVPVE